MASTWKRRADLCQDAGGEFRFAEEHATIIHGRYQVSAVEIFFQGASRCLCRAPYLPHFSTISGTRSSSRERDVPQVRMLRSRAKRLSAFLAPTAARLKRASSLHVEHLSQTLVALDGDRHERPWLKGKSSGRIMRCIWR